MPKKLPVNAEFEGHIESYDEAVVDLARRTRAFVLSRAPGSKELTYNNHVPAVAFTPTGALKHAFCHVAVYTKHVNLGFNRGAELDDPEGKLEGTGKRIRHVKIRARGDLRDPAIAALLDAAIETVSPQ